MTRLAGVLAISMATLGPAGAAAQTHLTTNALGQAGQEYAGVWRNQDGELRRFLFGQGGTMQVAWLEGGSALAQEPQRGARIEVGGYSGPLARLSAAGQLEYRGLSLFIQRNATVCKPYAWWGPAVLALNGLRARMVVDGRKVEEAQCRLTQEPDRLETNYERVVNLRFVPVAPGRYIHIVAVPDRGAYKAAVRFEWNYGELRPGRVRVSARAPQGGLVPVGDYAPNGSYEYVTESPGVYEFVVEVIDQRGQVIHRDRAIAEIPRI